MLRGINSEDTVLTLHEFISAVEMGVFTDYDGYGCGGWEAKRVYDDGVIIHPSKMNLIPDDVDIIVWFNR
jgi:hypothetical protein